LQNSHPQFIEQIRLLYGEASESFFLAMEAAAQTSIRINPFKNAHVFQDAENIEWCELGKHLKERPSFIADPLFHAGTYYVQEASSMFLYWVVRQILPELKKHTSAIKVLDLCAAPGGKSTLLASVLEEQDFLVANEIIKSRMPVLKENMQKWGTLNYACTSLDPKQFQALPHYFDLLVVDAPCSGEGMFRKDLESRNQWSPENVDLCAARQSRILEDVLPSLRSGGYLIYSTCTFNTKEDEDQINRLVEMGYEPVPITIPDTWQIQQCMQHTFKFPFHLTPGEGFYIACLRKPSNDNINHPIPKSKSLPYCNKSISAYLSEWFDKGASLSFIEHNGTYFALHKKHETIWEQLLGSAMVFQVGMPIGELDKNKALMPAHELAMSIFHNKNLPNIELNLTQAKQFLRKDVLQITEAALGWHIVRYNGFALGWVKVLGNRINNYLPASYRVLKAI
jgi:16S rRNA C967 or C1407 C5-methylase (RsmB/RsmF family)/NOL1/NOP2/fmu family ribosome biogenesis protein